MPIEPDIVAGVARRLAEHAGLELPTWVIEARAAMRMTRLGLAPQAYLELVDAPRGASELGALCEAVRVGETRLFRHRPQVTALALAVAPRLRGRVSVRAWSAGCAGGEEAATLAVALAGALPGSQLAILGTDLSADAIAAAREGSFPASALEHVPEESRGAFVADAEAAGRIRLRPELAACITFERANLLDAAPGTDFDVVWCRNVLIYFTAAAKRRAIERLVGATAIGGALFVGYSESLRDVPELEPERAGEAVFYVRRGRSRATPVAGIPIPSPLPPPPPSPSVSPSVLPVPVPLPTPARAPVEVISLVGHPSPDDLAEALGALLASHALHTLVIDLDGADLLGDDLAPVLRRACAALRAAHVSVELRATRAGARRWLARHGLGESAP